MKLRFYFQLKNICVYIFLYTSFFFFFLIFLGLTRTHAHPGPLAAAQQHAGLAYSSLQACRTPPFSRAPPLPFSPSAPSLASPTIATAARKQDALSSPRSQQERHKPPEPERLSDRTSKKTPKSAAVRASPHLPVSLAAESSFPDWICQPRPHPKQPPKPSSPSYSREAAAHP